jgi:hypothetical protein
MPRILYRHVSHGMVSYLWCQPFPLECSCTRFHSRLIQMSPLSAGACLKRTEHQLPLAPLIMQHSGG